MTQIICDICRKPIRAGEIYSGSNIKQKNSEGEWRDIDVCKSCARAILRLVAAAPNTPIPLNMETMKKIQEKENSNGTNNL